MHVNNEDGAVDYYFHILSNMAAIENTPVLCHFHVGIYCRTQHYAQTIDRDTCAFMTKYNEKKGK